MRWRNHKIVTFCAVYSMTGCFIPAAAALVGSVLPDVLELGGLLKHRTLTHYPAFWAGALFALWAWYRAGSYLSLTIYACMFLVSGGLLHVFEDALSTGGVPVYTPYGTKIGVGIYKTGTIGEELTTVALVFMFLLFAFARNFLNTDHINQQTYVLLNILRSYYVTK